MSAKHTPGPWTVYDPEMPDTEATYGIDGLQGQPVVYFGLTQNDGVNLLEDARLIAAAPELLDALQYLAAEFRSVVNSEFATHRCPDPAKDDPAYLKAMAAITKAIG